ncbi:MAG: hypothetical protein AAB658_08760 [Chloroflexota bacterium]
MTNLLRIANVIAGLTRNPLAFFILSFFILSLKNVNAATYTVTSAAIKKVRLIFTFGRLLEFDVKMAVIISPLTKLDTTTQSSPAV